MTISKMPAFSVKKVDRVIFIPRASYNNNNNNNNTFIPQILKIHTERQLQINSKKKKQET
jgi:hypothetical protein